MILSWIPCIVPTISSNFFYFLSKKEVPKRMDDERSGFYRETFYRIKGSLAMQLNQYFE